MNRLSLDMQARRVIVLLLVGLCAACIPASVPPQLAYTPGPAVRVIDGLYDSGVFRVHYPADWRVITSAAGDPVQVIFAATDGDALMIVGEQVDSAPAPAGYDGPLQSEQREISLADGVTVTLILNAAPDHWAQRLALFEQVVASVRASAA